MILLIKNTFIDKSVGFCHTYSLTTNNKRIRARCGTIENLFSWRLNYEFTNKSAIQFYLLIKENCITIIMYFKYLYIALMLVFQLLWLPLPVLVLMLFLCCLSSFAALHLLFRLILTSFESITMYRFLSKLSPAAHALSFRFFSSLSSFSSWTHWHSLFVANVFQL